MLKQLTAILLFCSLSTLALANRVWLDDDWVKTSKSDASFYYNAPLKKTDGLWPISIYYKSTGKLRFKGTLDGTNVKAANAVGPYSYHYDDGSIEGDGQFDKHGDPTGTNHCYYRNGNPDCESHYENGKRNGEQKEFYRNGKVSRKWTAVAGKHEGDDTYLYKNGAIKQVVIWKDGKREGVSQGFYQNGKLENRKTYKNDLLTKRELFYENGQQRSVSMYANNRRNGLAQDWSETGVLISSESYKSDRLEGESKEFFKDGSPRTLAHYHNGKKVGIYKVWSKDGTPVYDDIYNDHGQQTLQQRFVASGKLYSKTVTAYDTHGKITQRDLYKYYGHDSPRSHQHEDRVHDTRINQTYDNDGQLSEEIRFRNGEREGRLYSRDPYETGLRHATLVANYHNGKRDGAFSLKSDDGKTLQQGSYHRSHEVGHWIRRDEDTEVTADYNNAGLLSGERKTVSSNGKLLTLEHYTNGKLDGDYVSYHKDGTLKAKGRYHHGKRTGLWRIPSDAYFLDNSTDIGHYRNGVQIGDWKSVNAKGYLLMTSHYDNKGRRQGVWYTFRSDGLLERRTQFKNGKKDGKQLTYKDGKLYEQTFYKNGREIDADPS